MVKILFKEKKIFSCNDQKEPTFVKTYDLYVAMKCYTGGDDMILNVIGFISRYQMTEIFPI